MMITPVIASPGGPAIPMAGSRSDKKPVLRRRMVHGRSLLEDRLPAAKPPGHWNGRATQMSAALGCLLALAAGWGFADEPQAESPARDKPQPMPAVFDAKAERIIQQMQSAAEKLGRHETGSATQDVQKSILAELDELLKTPPQQPPKPNPNGGQSGNAGGQSNSQQQNANSGQPQTSPQQSTGRNSTQQRPQPGSQRNRRDAEDSTERTGPARAAEIAAARRKRLEVEVWGHLPEHLREQLLNTYGEKMVPQYEQLVRKFYEALSEPTDRAGSQRRPD
jgi:hypothetical protein